VQKGTPVKDNIGRRKLDLEIEEQKEIATRELAAISQRHELAPPSTPQARPVTPDLTPDSMASRIPEFSKIMQHNLATDDFSFDRMDGRAGNSVAV